MLRSEDIPKSSRFVWMSIRSEINNILQDTNGFFNFIELTQMLKLYLEGTFKIAEHSRFDWVAIRSEINSLLQGTNGSLNVIKFTQKLKP